KRYLVDIPIDYMTGDRAGGQSQNQGFGALFAQSQPQSQGSTFVEHFRRGADGQIADTQYELVSREDAYYQGQSANNDQGFWGGAADNGGRSYYPGQGSRLLPPQPPPQPFRSLFGLFRPWSEQPPPQPVPNSYWRQLN
ncbi:MAG TPA: hypothetical protein VEF90_07390, partial [Xanthobacteraceae bacterium]|nr:hypothetical protein [Xanthobacteraceae bacterium]